MNEGTKKFLQNKFDTLNHKLEENRTEVDEYKERIRLLEQDAAIGQEVADGIKVLLKSDEDDAITVTVRVDTVQAEKDIERTRVAVERLAEQLDRVSAGGSSLLTVSP